MSDLRFTSRCLPSGLLLPCILLVTALTLSNASAQSILLKSGEFNPGDAGKSKVDPVSLSLDAAEGENRLVLLQWDDPVDQSRVDWLRSLGGRTILYVPRNACFALVPRGLDPDQLKELSRSGGNARIRWISPLSTRWKMDHVVAKRLRDHGKSGVNPAGRAEYIVQMVKTGLEAGFEDVLRSRAEGVRVHSEAPLWTSYYVTVSAAELLSLARENAVLWIEESPRMKLLGERANLSVTNSVIVDNSCVTQGLQDPEAVSLGLTDWFRARFTMHDTGPNDFLYIDLASVPDYTLQAGDVLEYEIFWPVSADPRLNYQLIGFDFATDETWLRNESAVDQNGKTSHPNADIRQFALGNAYHRMISIPSGMTGQIIRQYMVACEYERLCEHDPDPEVFCCEDDPEKECDEIDAIANLAAYIRNIRITDGSGETRFVIWDAGQETPRSARSIDSSPLHSYSLDTGDYEGFLNRIGVRGENVIVQVLDDGISQGIATGEPLSAHPDLIGRISGIENASIDQLGDSGAGHGHLQASIIAGDPLGSGLRSDGGYLIGQGMAPASKIFATKIFSNDDTFTIRSRDSLIRKGYEEGARISNNSWGSSASGDYDVEAQLFDLLTRDTDQFMPGLQQMLHIIGAGNDGAPPPNESSVNSPATAKNVVSVGAAENCDASPVLDKSDIQGSLTDSFNDLAGFSSRGQGHDERFQVHVTAPGTHIYGAASDSPNYDGAGVSGRDPVELLPGEEPDAHIYAPPFQTSYTWSSGTSHAAPIVAGASALLMQFFQDKQDHVASPALLKASLVVNGIDMRGGLLNDPPVNSIMDFLPNPDQGWGRLSVEAILSAQSDMQFYDQEQLLTSNGEEHTFRIEIPNTDQPLLIALVWTDPAGSTAVSNTLVNDLDLVADDGLNAYWGNVYMEGRSVASDVNQRDSVNNVETIRLNPPHERFAYDVTVRAASLNDDGVPGSGSDIEQDYALLILNGIDRSGQGSLAFDRSEYDCTSNNQATVWLTDLDNRGQENIQVNVSSLTKGDSETVTLVETEVNNGIYAGTIEINQSAVPIPESGFLSADELDTIRAIYVDNTDGLDVTAESGVDCRFIIDPDLPDLLVGAAGITDPDFLVGEGFSTEVIWLNVGGSAAPISLNSFYASPDQVITGDGNDVLLRDYYILGIDAGESINNFESNGTAVAISTNQLGAGRDQELEPGVYYLGIMVDSNNAINEGNEDNNTFILDSTFEVSAVTPGLAQELVPPADSINVAIFDTNPFNTLQSRQSRPLDQSGRIPFNRSGIGHPAPWKLNSHPLIPGFGGSGQGHWCQYPMGKKKTGGVVSSSLIPVDEVEPNDGPYDAPLLPLTFDLGGDRDVDVTGRIENAADIDYYTITLSRGDVLGVACIGDAQLDPVLALTNEFGTEQVTNDDHQGIATLYPPESPLPGGEGFLDSAFSYVVPVGGEFRLKVSSFQGGSSGNYILRARLRRAGFESEALPEAQKVFLDFDGETINALDIFGVGSETAVLSPLSAFLGAWGLTAEDEGSVIDAIIAGLEENFTDLRLESLNGDRDVDGINGHFDLEFLNSRDHEDPFGDPNVSRVIFGGTAEEIGIDTIGISESIDPGNYGGEDTAVVLLDMLSAAPPDPNSVNSIARGSNFSLIDAIGLVVGTTGAHEIGHYIGNWHTENGNNSRCVMDAGGVLDKNIAGVGDDGILGTGDDVDSAFIRDVYDLLEGVSVNNTSENTDVRSAYGLSTASGVSAGGGRTLRWQPGEDASQYDVYFDALADLEVNYVSHLVDDVPISPGLVPVDIASGLILDPENQGVTEDPDDDTIVTDDNDPFPDLVVAWHGGNSGPVEYDDQVVLYLHNGDYQNPDFTAQPVAHPSKGGFPEVSSLSIATVDSPPLPGQGRIQYPPDFRYEDRFPFYRRPHVLITTYNDGSQRMDGDRDWNQADFPWPDESLIIPPIGVPGSVYLLSVNNGTNALQTLQVANAMDIAVENPEEPEFPDYFPIRLAIPEQINCVAVNDFDGDGDFDLCVGADRGDVVLWYENLQSEVIAHNNGSALLDIEFPYDDPTLFKDGVILAILIDMAEEAGEPLPPMESAMMQHFRALPIAQSFDDPYGDAHDIAAEDINGDERPDILTVSVQDDAIYYFQNDDLDQTSPLGNKPVLWGERVLLAGKGDDGPIIESNLDGVNNIELVDMNRDGRIDIIVSAFNAKKVSVFRNDGDMTFSEIILTESLDEVEDIYIEDINGDSFLDVIAVSAVEDRLEWYANDGNLGFTSSQVVVDIDRPQGITVTDLNGDLLPDIAAASSFNVNVTWLENSPQVVSEQHRVGGSLVLPYTEVPELDFNTVYVWNVVSTAGPFETIGDTWSFRTQPTRMDLAPVVGPMNVEMDGFLNIDIPFQNVGPAYPTLPEGLALDLRDWRMEKDIGPFPWYITVVLSGNSIIGDADDIIAVNFINSGLYGPGEEGEAKVTLFMQELVAANDLEEGEYHVFIIMDGAQIGVSLRTEYFTNHSFFEDIILMEDKLVVANVPDMPDDPTPPHESVEIDSATNFDWGDSQFASLYDFYIEEGQFKSTTFVERPIASSATDIRALVAADLTGDEQLDVIGGYLSGGGNVDFYVNDAVLIPGFQVVNLSQELNSTEQLESVDIDSDGDNDLLAVSLDDSQAVWFDNQNSMPHSFIKRDVTTQAYGARTVSAGDINGDGLMDVLTGASVSGGVRISMQQWVQPPEFSDVVIDESRGTVLAVKAADIDSDGDADIVASYQETSEIVYYENAGNQFLPFNSFVVSDVADGAKSVACGDVDHDGDIDIVSGNFNDNQIVVYRNNGGPQPSFTAEVLPGVASGVSSVALGNLDGDPELEIVAALTGINEVWWYDSSSQAGYTSTILSTTHQEPRAVFIGDLDDDQLRDVVVGSASDGRVAWYENTPTHTFSGIDLKSPEKADLPTSDYDPPSTASLNFNTQYNWQVVALNQLREAQGNVWEFTTGLPDLVIDQIGFPFVSVGSSNPLDINLTIRNRGSATSNAVRARVFGSSRSDLALIAQDIIIGDVSVASLAPKESVVVTVPVNLSLLTQGDGLGELKIYFVGAQVDYLDEQPGEFSEENIFKVNQRLIVEVENQAGHWSIYR